MASIQLPAAPPTTKGHFKGSPLYTVVGAFGVWAILFLSKFVILEAEDLLFGDLVELGSFVDVMLLVAALVVTRELVRRVYLWLGASGGSV